MNDKKGVYQDKDGRLMFDGEYLEGSELLIEGQWWKYHFALTTDDCDLALIVSDLLVGGSGIRSYQEGSQVEFYADQVEGIRN